MASKADTKPIVGLPVILVATVGIALVGGFWYLERASIAPAKGPVLTADAKAYTRNLRLGGVDMKATESAAHQMLVEITGNITNAGDRKLRSVRVNCIFYDAYGQVVLKERVEIVKTRYGGLAPNETKPFRLPFDTLPGSWNQGLPQLVIAEIMFD
ncbi:MAG: DUF3426 domain-containing protein [Acidobacteria bacterium]|nr:DUF3426 domain-containing protein [Acidobacteriota bacterium]